MTHKDFAHQKWLDACPLTMFMREHGITQTRLGSILGCSRQTINAWINGMVGISQPYLDLMHNKLGIDSKHMAETMDKWRKDVPGV